MSLPFLTSPLQARTNPSRKGFDSRGSGRRPLGQGRLPFIPFPPLSPPLPCDFHMRLSRVFSFCLGETRLVLCGGKYPGPSCLSRSSLSVAKAVADLWFSLFVSSSHSGDVGRGSDAPFPLPTSWAATLVPQSNWSLACQILSER